MENKPNAPEPAVEKAAEIQLVVESDEPQQSVAEITLEPPATKLAPIAEPPAAAAQPEITDADVLTASRLVKLLSEAEERGYMRARRELIDTAKSSASQHIPLWSNPRRVEAEAESTIEIGDEFLSTIRPTIWD